MKHVSPLVCLLLFSYCTFGQTEKESQQIVGEILFATEKYNKTWETLDMEKVAQYHSDSSFRYYRNMKLGVGSNDEFKKQMPKYMNALKSWKMEVSNPVVQVLDKNAAVIGFTGKAEMVTKDHKISDFGTGAYTYVWKKLNDEWRIVHIHESTK
ncbi:MAG: nuclear transport factor 2 family protein [Saprospiraceae bacterium]|nr:nuclear transport factor 2 family protein [Saprospiraceae bacterium]